MAEPDVERYRKNLQAEIDGVALYRALEDVEQSPELSEVYRRFTESELRHAAIWRERLREAGAMDIDLGERASWRTRVLIWMARRLGPGVILPTVIAHEQTDSERYGSQPEAVAAGMPGDERSHARLFRSIGEESSTGLVGGALMQLEGRHPSAGGNALRAAVLGANDGLVSNVSLVMGVAGAELASRNILVTGIAGLLAGSLSMALGEWLSVQSARELFAHQIAIEKEELAAFPNEELEELTLIYRAKGVAEEEARALATRIIGDSGTALDTLAREELGIEPDELGGSAWVAAITSFVVFTMGAIIPVIPYFFGGGFAAIVASVLLSAIALFLIGAGITVITGRNVWLSGMRQVVFGIAAAAITFGIGRLIGVGLAG